LHRVDTPCVCLIENFYHAQVRNIPSSTIHLAKPVGMKNTFINDLFTTINEYK